MYCRLFLINASVNYGTRYFCVTSDLRKSDLRVSVFLQVRAEAIEKDMVSYTQRMTTGRSLAKCMQCNEGAINDIT